MKKNNKLMASDGEESVKQQPQDFSSTNNPQFVSLELVGTQTSE